MARSDRAGAAGLYTDPSIDNCVWQPDLNVRGCPFYAFSSCIAHCTRCIDRDGPDDCAQLKCGAFCAKQEGDECLSNYRQLCEIAVEENFPWGNCNVRCSGTVRSVHPPSSLVKLTVAMAAMYAGSGRIGLTTKQVALVASVASLTFLLQGCDWFHHCDYSPHLSWEPAQYNLERRADWFDDNGLWQGNPTWTFSMSIEIEDYRCKSIHRFRKVCMEWTVHEESCEEQDFGVCKCHELHPVNNYCQKWGCHTLEADQEVCYWSCTPDSGCSEECRDSAFDMTEEKYSVIMDQKFGNQGWWQSAWGSVYPDDVVLVYYPPVAAFSSRARRQVAHYAGECIVNGDNKVLSRYDYGCSSWREIETEIQQCECLEGAEGGNSCLRWRCEERDVGLFSVLFKTAKPISHLVSGIESEDYACKALDKDGKCVAWEGTIESTEEVEMTRCECDGDCASVGGTWKCDEYELPKSKIFHHPMYSNNFVWFLVAEIVFMPMLMFWVGMCFAPGKKMQPGKDENGRDIQVAVLTWRSWLWMGKCNATLAFLLLLVLVVTFGLAGFACLSLPFWFVRCLCISRCAYWSEKEGYRVLPRGIAAYITPAPEVEQIRPLEGGAQGPASSASGSTEPQRLTSDRKERGSNKKARRSKSKEVPDRQDAAAAEAVAPSWSPLTATAPAAQPARGSQSPPRAGLVPSSSAVAWSAKPFLQPAEATGRVIGRSHLHAVGSSSTDDDTHTSWM
eukprot:CAMPEP_0178405196 /NCGR_PEP_ID=MMETSP0689_2-20121128/18275_1 /TAXON_ID=160604 /ORGANISM="Amphidinium massartii, Strain CS-259" /LENGTH=731 /DNA_ID=CAMNT_0020026205 /DNA_START=76 /DNA_END=2272 /DNA_ORIENTATION=+